MANLQELLGELANVQVGRRRRDGKRFNSKVAASLGPRRCRPSRARHLRLYEPESRPGLEMG